MIEREANRDRHRSFPIFKSLLKVFSSSPFDSEIKKRRAWWCGDFTEPPVPKVKLHRSACIGRSFLASLACG